MSSNIRVRFAPSPTGKLHVGGARTALFNWAYARRNGGKFLLRIEDTDEERSTAEYERAILEGLHWLGIQWDEGPDIGGPCAPYRQTERAARHKELATKLFADGWAYRCFCSAERLEALREAQSKQHLKPEYDGLCRKLAKDEVERRVAAGEKYVLRFAVPAGETRFLDHVRGDVVFQNKEVDDWVMVRSDGTPTYNFVVVCDDIDMGITHVFRGEEHLVNTPKQVLLYRAFGKPIPEFGHLPLMLGTDGKKLSKRTGDTALQDYRDKGYPKDAIVNFLCLQGWALNGTTEIFSVGELVANFDIKDVSKAGAIFDIDKFQWLAGEYIRKEPLEEFAAHCEPFVVAAGLATSAELVARRDWWLAVARGEQERVRTYGELPPRIAYLFAPDHDFAWDGEAEKNAKKHATGVETLRAYATWLDERLAAGKRPTELRDETKAWIAARGLKIPGLFQPLRCALTGQAGGPDLFEIMELLGTERVRARIRRGAERLSA
ncbi:MAG: glutamate--tRNA ligase [Planctomycetes bacterium]|nr:glutamate--tRNA ligase [Planctomycetota bacterium]